MRAELDGMLRVEEEKHSSQIAALKQEAQFRVAEIQAEAEMCAGALRKAEHEQLLLVEARASDALGVQALRHELEQLEARVRLLSDHNVELSESAADARREAAVECGRTEEA